METVRDFIFLGCKITADGDCSHEIKRRLLLGRKAMTKLDSILKTRDITLPTKVPLVKAMVFPVVMYRCESWTIKLSTKELMLLNCGVEEDSWESLDCKKIQPVHPKGNQSWIFIGRTVVESETSILWAPDVNNWLIGKDWCWERLKAGGEVDDSGWNGWMASPTQWTWVWVGSGSWWWTRKPGVLQSTGSQRVRHDWATELKYLFSLRQS